MKMILIDEDKGGDLYIRVAELESIAFERDVPEVGFYCPATTKILFYGEVTWLRKNKLKCKRNVMRYISKLFGGQNRGKETDTRQ